MQHNQRDIGGTSRTEGLSPRALVPGGSGQPGVDWNEPRDVFE